MCENCERKKQRKNRNRSFYLSENEVLDLIKILSNAQLTGQIAAKVCHDQGDKEGEEYARGFGIVGNKLYEEIKKQFERQKLGEKLIDAQFAEAENQRTDEISKAEIRQMKNYRLN